MSDKEERSKKPRIGISVGDLNGIGAEIIIKTFMDNRMSKLMTPIIYASPKVFSFYRKLLDINFNYFSIKDADKAHPKKVNVLQAWKHDPEIKPGEPDPENGEHAYQSLKLAVADLKNQKIDALVTAPINKDHMQAKGFEFPGHTEYLTQESGKDESLMLLVHDELRIGVATGHIAVSQIAQELSAEKISKKLDIFIDSLKQDFGIIKPKIALLGLNPHAGENGKLGTEDADIILPVIEKYKEDGHLVFGPFPADGFFGAKKHQQFDGILGMYHDQGLIPFKTLAFDEGVNYTAGLSFIRTSPDHGTGYDIAGQNVASENSFRNAVFLALDVWKNRM